MEPVATHVEKVEKVVRQDAALLEEDLAAFLDALTDGGESAAHATAHANVYVHALRSTLHEPVADALGSKAGQQALPPRPDAPGGTAPLRPSMVYWAYRNYRGFSGEFAPDFAAIRRTAVAVRVLMKAAVALDDIQDGSAFRYGEPALHVTHGVPVALNTGAWLITSALRHVGQPAATQALLESVSRGFTGQAADLASRTDTTRASLLTAPHADRVRFWESVAALKTGTLFRMPLEAALAALGVREDDRDTLDDAMRRLGLASQLFNDLTDVVPEFGGANTHEDFDGLGNRVFLELLGTQPPSVGADLRAYVLDHPKLDETLLQLSAEAVEAKRAAKEAVRSVCRSDLSAAYFDLTIDRKGHLIDRLHRTLVERGSA
ncbi:polyprenyl synthetase family protein [Streptomyces niveiscabiei]|uniref:polyprenyl synthetase family protein n=1 Tax=Streptomyces niveiscabiei TaxID=164115 RepID=UPI001F0B41DC|nr:polyprenyl synthetase family protein [Streptomyces niveiscabiei]